ncbi:hypothetical protein MCOR27_004269 [Pyricularia oryzae]|uniref:Uncharacterized protein n=1 Tax=Pyricularia grisea TaxID=148305 RepID=A0ABQ8N4Z1_PYRGI|nr:hypothetical protein MCOR01_005304 [Pyricularia oryzae]KAI6291387.1 hypothetical protein MCOR33_010657 [Pyricularia grisea]KAI6252421.1 hypothetical protein MCOR19_010970 [Pyricularia oryzae]KAI6271748.1 hypothetical protein MCOR26_007665 [Pyricularia oryzae]KAI6281241.1 hypothetical protein MCOR27_004269 [Pyricularia oryzae]
MRFTTVQIFALLAIGVAATPVSLHNGHTLQARDSDDERDTRKKSGRVQGHQDHTDSPHDRNLGRQGSKSTDDRRPSDKSAPAVIRHSRVKWSDSDSDSD